MFGLRVDGCRPPGSFPAVFAPILEDLRRFWWDESPLDHPGMADDAELAAVSASLDPAACIPPDTLLPRFARYVKDFDWCIFHGFRRDPGPAEAVRRRLRRSGPASGGPPPDVEVVFRNLDGACWCVFARDETLLDSVEAHASRRRGWSSRRLDWGRPF